MVSIRALSAHITPYISSLTYGKCHRSGASTTPSSEMNSATMIFRMVISSYRRGGPTVGRRLLKAAKGRRANRQDRQLFSAGWLDGGITDPTRGVPVRFLMTMNAGSPAPDQQLYAEMGRFVEELTRAGVLLATGGLDRGTHVTSSGGSITLTDGPFTESKEVIVSFALIEVRSKEEALELAGRFWKMVGDGEGDIRQVFGPEGY